jgi:hypothetical protein
MLRFQTAEQLQQLAANQTPTYKSAMLGYSRPLTDHFQISGDATIVNLSQPIVLPGVDPALGSLPASTEYYYSLQLMGSSLFKDGDMYIAGFRYSRLSNSNLYVVDFNTRYPLWSEFHISPRLRLGYRVGRDADFKEYTVLPSILLDYYWTKELSLEFELGAQRTWNQQSGITDINTELFLTAGIRYDFYADDATRTADKRNCGTPVAAALCRYSNSADRSNCTAPPTSCR